MENNMDELQLLRQKLCSHFHCTFHGMYSLIGNYVCDYCKLEISSDKFNEINASFYKIAPVEYVAKRLYAGETIRFEKEHYSKAVGLAEKVSGDSKYSNGIIIFGDENPDYMNVRIWLVPKNTV